MNFELQTFHVFVVARLLKLSFYPMRVEIVSKTSSTLVDAFDTISIPKNDKDMNSLPPSN